MDIAIKGIFMSAYLTMVLINDLCTLNSYVNSKMTYRFVNGESMSFS